MTIYIIIPVFLTTFLAWRYFIKPSNTKNWRADQAKLAWTSIENNKDRINKNLVPIKTAYG